MTKQELLRYKGIKVELDQLEGTMSELLTRIRNRMESPAAPVLSKTPKGKGGNRGLDATYSRYLTIRDMYNAKWDQLIDEQMCIERAIEALPPMDRALLRYRYIEGYSWEVICVKMNYSWDSIHRRHRRALVQLQDAA